MFDYLIGASWVSYLYGQNNVGGRGKGAGKHSRDVIAVARDPPQGIGERAKGQEKNPVIQIEYQGNAKKSACAIRSRGG